MGQDDGYFENRDLTAEIQLCNEVRYAMKLLSSNQLIYL